MKLTRTLCITVALLTAGVLATIGPALAPSASAQQGPKTPAVLQNADPSHAQPAGKAPPKWEFGYVEAPRPLSEASFESVCRKMEPQGWEYCGSQEMTLDRTPLPKGATKSGPTLVLVFKRSAHPQDGKRSERAESVRQLELLGFDVERAQDAEKLAHLEKEKLRHLRMDAELLQKALDQLTGKQAALAEREKAEADRLTKDAQAARDKDGRLSRLPATEPLIKEGQARVVLGEIQLPLSEGANSNKASAESIQIIPLGIEASAPKLAKILTELFGKQGTFQADERSNSLIVKADDKTKEEVQKLLDRLEKQAVIKKQRDKEELEKMIRRK